MCEPHISSRREASIDELYAGSVCLIINKGLLNGRLDEGFYRLPLINEWPTREARCPNNSSGEIRQLEPDANEPFRCQWVVGSPSGTGFLYGDNRTVLTAAHGLDDIDVCDMAFIFGMTSELAESECVSGSIMIPQGQVRMAESLLFDGRQCDPFGTEHYAIDVAKIRLSEPIDERISGPPIQFDAGNSFVAVHSPIHAFGHPFGLVMKFTRGQATVVDSNLLNTSHYFISDMESMPGYSGAPVFNDEGYFVGMIVRTWGWSSASCASNSFCTSYVNANSHREVHVLTAQTIDSFLAHPCAQMSPVVCTTPDIPPDPNPEP